MYRSLAAEQPKNDKEPCTFYSAVVIQNRTLRVDRKKHEKVFFHVSFRKKHLQQLTLSLQLFQVRSPDFFGLIRISWTLIAGSVGSFRNTIVGVVSFLETVVAFSSLTSAFGIRDGECTSRSENPRRGLTESEKAVSKEAEEFGDGVVGDMFFADISCRNRGEHNDDEGGERKGGDFWSIWVRVPKRSERSSCQTGVESDGGENSAAKPVKERDNYVE